MSDKADGDFGGITERAVITAQNVLGLEQTGIAAFAVFSPVVIRIARSTTRLTAH